MWHFSGLVPWNQCWVQVCKASTQPCEKQGTGNVGELKIGRFIKLITSFATSLLLHGVVWHLCLGICCSTGLRIFPYFTDACFLWNRPDTEVLKHYRLHSLSSKTQNPKIYGNPMSTNSCVFLLGANSFSHKQKALFSIISSVCHKWCTEVYISVQLM